MWRSIFLPFFQNKFLKKNKFFSFLAFFLYQEHTKICEMRGVENNATRKYNGKPTTSNKKKNSRGRKYFLLFQFLLIFPVSKVVQFYIHFVFFSVDLQEGYKITNFDDFSFKIKELSL